MSRARLSLVATAALAVLAALFVVSCRPGTVEECNGTVPTTAPVTCPTTTTAPPRPLVVGVVGDSITAQSASTIASTLTAAGYTPIVRGRSGLNSLEIAPTVDLFVPEHPDIMIFELGTNDVTEIRYGVPMPDHPDRPATGQDTADRLKAYATKFPGACIAVTTVTTHRTSAPNGPATWNKAAADIDAALHTGFRHVVEWNDAEWAQRTATPPVLLLQSDLIHPTDPAGRVFLAGLDKAMADTCKAELRP